MAADDDSSTAYRPKASDIVEDDKSNPRLVQADKRLLEASSELLQAVGLYVKSANDDDNLPLAALLPEDVQGGDAVRDPEKLSALVDGLLDERKNKKATVSSRFGSAMGKVYPLLSLTLGTTSAIAEGTTFVPVKGAVNALSLLLAVGLTLNPFVLGHIKLMDDQIADQEHTKSTDFLKQLDRLSYQSLRVAALRKSGVEMNDILLEKATDLMTAVLVFFKGALLYLRHNYFYNVGKGVIFGPHVYADAKAELEGAINEFDQALLLQVALKRIDAPAAEATSQKQDSATTAGIIRWLQASHWEVEAEFSRHSRSRVKGTLNWVFDVPEFKSWRVGGGLGERAPRSLWLTGLPGVGKSTIAAYVIQALRAQHPDAAVLYFFCKAGDDALSSLPKLIRSLAAQLVDGLPMAREYLQKLQGRSFDVVKPDPVFLCQSLLRDTLRGNDKDVFVILDGLDECGGDGEQLELVLKSLTDLSIKLLVSSRVTGEISSGLSASVRRELSYDDSQGDIELYIDHAVGQSRSLQNGFKALGVTPATFLSEKSGGNFLWVRLVLDSLKRKASARDFQDVIDTLPTTLEGIYEQIFRRLESNGSLPRTLALLGFVLHSERPLTMPETEAMVRFLFDEDIFDLSSFVKSECGSFLRQTATRPARLYIVHETFRSFITNPASSGDFCVKVIESHLQLAIASLKCLCAPSSHAVRESRVYALHYWHIHVDMRYQHIHSVTGERDTYAAHPMAVALLAQLHAFCTSRATVRAWMRDRILQRQDKHVSSHDFSGPFETVHRIARYPLDPHPADTSPEINEWLSIVAVRNFTDDVSENFNHVWLNTNWEEFEQAGNMAKVGVELLSPKFSRKISHISGNDGLMFIPHDGEVGVQVANAAIALLAQLRHHRSSITNSEVTEALQWAVNVCWEQWHLHEALGYHLAEIGEVDKAIASFENALKVDTKKYPSSASLHAVMVARKRMQAGDYEGAEQAYRDGLKCANPDDTVDYWTEMANVWKGPGNVDRMIEIYREGISEAPNSGDVFWTAMASVLCGSGARQQEWHTYREAMVRDPENKRFYGSRIRGLAEELTSLCAWQLVPAILTQGPLDEPERAAPYHRALGRAYMCQRRWAEALAQFETAAELVDDKSIFVAVGHACLGLGDTARSLTAYGAAFANGGDVIKQALTMGYAHVLAGAVAQAASLFRAGIAAALPSAPTATKVGRMLTGDVDDSLGQELFALRLQLGLCCEALGRKAEAGPLLESAVDGMGMYLKALDRDGGRGLVYRHTARTYFHVGLVEEKLGRQADARASLERAVFLFEKTAMEGDDEVQTSEADEATAALARVSRDGADDAGEAVAALPDLREKLGGMRLQRRLALKYITDWYCEVEWEPPRRRGKEVWNRVTFWDKRTRTFGDRRLVYRL